MLRLSSLRVAVLLLCAVALCGCIGSGDDTAAPIIDAGSPYDGPFCAPEAGDATTVANACSPFTAGCIRFDPTRVPSHPTL